MARSGPASDLSKAATIIISIGMVVAGVVAVVGVIGLTITLSTIFSGPAARDIAVGGDGILALQTSGNTDTILGVLPANVARMVDNAATCVGLMLQDGVDLTCVPFSIDNGTATPLLQSVGYGAALAVNGTQNVRSLASNVSFIGVAQDGNTVVLTGGLPASVMTACTPCAAGQVPIQTNGTCFGCYTPTNGTITAVAIYSVGNGTALAVDGTNTVRSLIAGPGDLAPVFTVVGSAVAVGINYTADAVRTCAPCAAGEYPVRSAGACYTCVAQPPPVTSVGIGVPLVANVGVNTIQSLVLGGTAGWGYASTGTTTTLSLNEAVYVGNGTMNPVVTLVHGDHPTPSVVAITVNQQPGVHPLCGACIPGQTTRLGANGTCLECFNVAATSIVTGGPGVDALARTNDTVVYAPVWTWYPAQPSVGVHAISAVTWIGGEYSLVTYPLGFPGTDGNHTYYDFRTTFTAGITTSGTWSLLRVNITPYVPAFGSVGAEWLAGRVIQHASVTCITNAGNTGGLSTAYVGVGAISPFLLPGEALFYFVNNPSGDLGECAFEFRVRFWV